MQEGKQHLYVSVTHNLIERTRNESTPFEVLVDDGQLATLQDLMKVLEEGDDYSLQRAPVPYKSADHDDGNERLTDGVTMLYTFLYDHGTTETRQAIEDMDVLPKLQNTDYDDPGYENSPMNK
ncbi:hypothetical protein SAMN05720606_10650 [Paenibacillus polysaccharolyticus]|uniref:Uncharacterized protein n=1 Tax=Paenibacillus polysaccharolyticus TaxID=582692 RepID=A0A1G5GX13_9BACL|nr:MULTISPECIES: hypothetical protein [Paenibacillus]MDP9701015.1 hypothetical protein [Paenibacillus intestini]SCY55178.1 hypothetical protein SAMN05720606_10650 [Paenibacillus polysaccharolyticus]